MEPFTILTWDAAYHRDLIHLSVEWLERYNLMEPADWDLLNDPPGYVLAGGGQVFFARADGEIVATACAVNNGDGTYELCKLGVTQAWQGRGIGEALVYTVVDFVRQQGAQAVVLYSNHKLVAARSLYQNVGFREVPHDSSKYMESDVKMILPL